MLVPAALPTNDARRPGFDTTFFAGNDDGSYPSAVLLPFALKFFGDTYTHVYVNNNGNITFDGALSTYTPFIISTTNRVIIAPFFADVDTRNSVSGTTTFGKGTFGGRSAFGVNWVNVGYFNSHDDRLNSFQLVLIERQQLVWLSTVPIADFATSPSIPWTCR